MEKRNRSFREMKKVLLFKNKRFIIAQTNLKKTIVFFTK